MHWEQDTCLFSALPDHICIVDSRLGNDICVLHILDCGHLLHIKPGGGLLPPSGVAEVRTIFNDPTPCAHYEHPCPLVVMTAWSLSSNSSECQYADCGVAEWHTVSSTVVVLKNHFLLHQCGHLLLPSKSERVL